MAISYIGGASADSTTVSLPAGAQAGDLAVVAAGRTNTNGPSIPGGWTDHGVTPASSGGSQHGSRLGSKVLTADDITAGNVGAWANAAEIIVGVWRSASAVDANSGAGGASTTITYPARSSLAAGSWQGALSTHRASTAGHKGGSLTGYTNRSSAFTSERCGLWDSAGSTSGIVERTLVVTGSSGNVGWTFEIIETPATFTRLVTWIGDE